MKTKTHKSRTLLLATFAIVVIALSSCKTQHPHCNAYADARVQSGNDTEQLVTSIEEGEKQN